MKGVKKPAYFQSATKKATKIDHEVALNKEQWFKLKTKFPVLNQALPSEGYAITSKLRSVRTTLPIITTQEPDETSKKIYVHTLLLPLTESHSVSTLQLATGDLPLHYASGTLFSLSQNQFTLKTTPTNETQIGSRSAWALSITEKNPN